LGQLLVVAQQYIAKTNKGGMLVGWLVGWRGTLSLFAYFENGLSIGLGKRLKGHRLYVLSADQNFGYTHH
jgi:hypothetical protein